MCPSYLKAFYLLEKQKISAIWYRMHTFLAGLFLCLIKIKKKKKALGSKIRQLGISKRKNNQ